MFQEEGPFFYQIFVSDKQSQNLAESISEKTDFLCVTEEPKGDHLLVKDEKVYFVPYKSRFTPMTFDLCELVEKRDSRIFRSKKDLLYRAIGFKKGCESIVDGTAGMGWDALCLWNMGHLNGQSVKIHAIERNPIVYSLLFGAVHQLKQRGLEGGDLCIHFSEGREYLNNLNESKRPDVIFLDPMFPEKKKKALPRKEMQIFRQIVGQDLDVAKVLEKSLEVARKRVVVKRPLKSSELLKGIHSQFLGKLIRYDVYNLSNISS